MHQEGVKTGGVAQGFLQSCETGVMGQDSSEDLKIRAWRRMCLQVL
jgi:hypothetical protein